MSIPAQGAVGAETKFKTGNRVQTAGEVNREAFYNGQAKIRWGQLSPDMAQAWERAAAAVLASATPAQPAGGVPDSLRVLSEALAFATAERKRTGDLYNVAARRAERTFEDLTEVYEAFEDAISKLRDAKDALADHCLALLASHPAGQSAGSALCSYVECAALGKSSCEDCRDTPRRDGQSAGSGAETITLTGDPGDRLAPWLLSGTDEEAIEALMRRSAGDVACLFFPTPVNVADPIRRTYYEGRAPRQQRLLAELLRRLKPAPDSTRTGQVGVPDIVRSAVANAAAADGFANGPAAKHYAALRALEWVETLLAARPAAPEAQGAWSFDMEAAPRDGSDVEIVNDRGQFIAQFDRSWGRSYADAGWWMVSDGKDSERPLRGDEPFAWRIPTKAPAPPASSGQGGR